MYELLFYNAIYSVTHRNAGALAAERARRLKEQQRDALVKNRVKGQPGAAVSSLLALCYQLVASLVK